MQNILKLVVQAVKDRRCIAIRYRQQKEIRVIEPHAVYTNERDEIVVDGYQTRGFSASGRPAPFWRPYRIKKITAISVLKENFTPRTAEGFTDGKKRYQRNLLAIVEYGGPSFTYSEEVLQNSMGPFLPERRIRNPF